MYEEGYQRFDIIGGRKVFIPPVLQLFREVGISEADGFASLLFAKQVELTALAKVRSWRKRTASREVFSALKAQTHLPDREWLRPRAA